MSEGESLRAVSHTYSRTKAPQSHSRTSSDDFDVVKQTTGTAVAPKLWASKSTWGRKTVLKPTVKPEPQKRSAPSPFDWEDSPEEVSPSKKKVNSTKVAGQQKKRRVGTCSLTSSSSSTSSSSAVVNVSVKSSVSINYSSADSRASCVSVESCLSLTSASSVSSVLSSVPSSVPALVSPEIVVSDGENQDQDSSSDKVDVKPMAELEQNEFNGLLLSKHRRRCSPDRDDLASLIYNNSEEDDGSDAVSQPLRRHQSMGVTSSPQRSIVEEMLAPSETKLKAARRNITTSLTAGSSKDSDRVPAMVKSASWPRLRNGLAVAKPSALATAGVCKRSEKALFTVVKDVCDATEMQEEGENQALMDSIDYSLDGLLASAPLPVRCLSCCSLASQAASPTFRQAIRSSGATNTMFSRLSDAPKSRSLALCTATIFFMLSRDRLNMDLDKSSLKLLVQLLRSESDSEWSGSADEHQYGKMQTKIKVLLMSTNVHGKHHLDLENLATGQMACEAILSLMSSLVGAAHRDDLRNFGGLGSLVDLIANYTKTLPDSRHCVAFPENMPSVLDRISRPVIVLADSTLKDRSARAYLLRDASRHNRANQLYIIQYSQASIFSSLAKLIMACSSYLCQSDGDDSEGADSSPSEDSRHTALSCLQPTLRLLVSLTHEQEKASVEACQQDGLLEAVLRCIVEVPRHVAEERRIDLILQAVSLLLNFSMHSWTAKSALTSLQPSWLIRDELPLSPIVALLEICEQYQAAASAYDLDALLDNRLAALKAAVAALPSSQDSPESSPCVGSESAESVANSRGQAQSHMDRSLVAAYLAMLIGLLARSSSSSRLALCNALGENSLKNMLRLLNYFLSFLKMAHMANENETNLISDIMTMLREFSATPLTLGDEDDDSPANTLAIE